MSDRVLIIAEAGVNHNGNVEIAKKLCKKAKECGADVVKFQTWITEKIITRTVEQAEYQIENTKKDQSQFEMLKALELSFDEFKEIKDYCDDIGIVFASTADENDSLDFLIDIGIPFIKIGSGEIGNIPFLRYAGSKGLPIILSTGMSTIEDVDLSVGALIQGGAKDITLLHCTTNYPCPFDEVNLLSMNTLGKKYKCKVGYSDHTEGIEAAIAAVAMGATVIEKHFTLDRAMEGPDHICSIEPKELENMVRAIRNVETALGDGIKKPAKSEIDIATVVKKRIVAKRNILKGKRIDEEDVCVKRSNSGVSASMWDSIVGSIAKKNYREDEGIE